MSPKCQSIQLNSAFIEYVITIYIFLYTACPQFLPKCADARVSFSTCFTSCFPTTFGEKRISFFALTRLFFNFFSFSNFHHRLTKIFFECFLLKLQIVPQFTQLLFFKCKTQQHQHGLHLIVLHGLIFTTHW